MSAFLRAILLFPLFLLAPHRAPAAGFKHSETIELSGIFSPQAIVRINNVNGSVTIHTWDRDEYRVAAVKKSREEKNLELIELRHDITADRAVLEVYIPKKKGWFSTSRIKGSMEIELLVPSSVKLDDISTTNGSVHLSDLTGSVNVSSVNGRIEASNLAGNAKLKTVNGSIEASFNTLPPGSDLSFNSVNGGIEVSLPEGLHADLSCSVVNGRIHSDFPITLHGGASSRKLNGTIGDGGTDLRARTVNGSIRWRQN